MAANMNYLMTDKMIDIYREYGKEHSNDPHVIEIRRLVAHSDCQKELIERNAVDAARWRKLIDLAAYGGTYKGEHVWRFRPIMGPHKNLLDAVDHMGE